MATPKRCLMFVISIVLVTFTVSNLKVRAQATEPIGLSAITSFDRLPYFKLDTIEGGFSSTDPAANNIDYNNYRYVDSNGDNVMLDMIGPGTVYRIWVTGGEPATYVKIYLDGATTPQVNMLARDLFAGTNAPFLAPLVGNDQVSSGGFYCYLPIPFAKSIRITTNGDNGTNGRFYYNIGYHIYAEGTQITTWTGNEDSTAARNLWNQVGADPKPTQNNSTVSASSDVASGTTSVLQDIGGPSSISDIKLHVASGLDVPPAPVVDNGRAFTGYSQFNMALNPSNNGAILTRRFDYGIGNQTANVYVNGSFVGEWATPGSDDGTHRWRERSFNIPAAFTAGQSSVAVKIEFSSSDKDWDEFYYWMYSLVPGSTTTLIELTDQLDVGDTGSESAHSYSINGSTWYGLQNYSYPQLATVTDNGRANKGYSQFVMALNPSNNGAILTRRFDYSVGNQTANVYVNGAFVGQWSTPGSNTLKRWLDSSFSIPASFTAGKSSVTIKVSFVSSAIDWNEFYYWMFSVVGNSNLLTDQLDVGNSVSESAHGYVDNTETFNGVRTFSYPGTNAAFDEGRAFKGYSQFVMALNPANRGAILERRFDYGVANQTANVYVNGALVGTWETAGSDNTNHWRNSSFTIPSSFTAGKSSITVKVSFVSSALDWNEFYYWMCSEVNGSARLTDQLDVGNTASETAHSYTINTQTWSGNRTFNYPDFITTLNNLWLSAYWDGASTAAVSAPLTEFFAVGSLAPNSVRSLSVGMDETNTMYVYFPMPFQNSAKITLSNQTGELLGGLYNEVAYQPFTDSFQNVGYFNTAYNTQLPTTTGKDMVYLDREGAGTFVGVVYSVYNGAASQGYLEGNERILVDNNQSPSINGTGTEDFFNAGWDFRTGPFTLQMWGNTAHVPTSSSDAITAYRLFLQDAIPFRNHLRVSMQHGGNDDVNVNSWLLAYYYFQPTDRLTLSDSLIVGNAASEAAHNYSITGQTWSGSHTYTFEGEFDATSSTSTGRAHKGTSQFTISIPASNAGIILRRLFDNSIANQEAAVYVNGAFVGNWYRAGNNTYHQWRMDDFLIPTSFTAGKTSITITIQFVSGTVDWNEFQYFAYAKSSLGG